jgi:hypothetical protein
MALADITLQPTGLDGPNDIRLYVPSGTAPASALSIILFNTTPLFGANDVILGPVQSGTVLWEQTQTLSQVANLTLTNSLDAEASETLGASAGLVLTGNLDALGSLSLGQTAGFSSTGSLDIPLDLALAQTAGFSSTGSLDIPLDLALAQTGSWSTSAQLSAAASTTITSHPDVAEGDTATFNLLNSFNTTAVWFTSAEIVANVAVSLNQTADWSTAALLDIYPNLVLVTFPTIVLSGEIAKLLPPGIPSAEAFGLPVQEYRIVLAVLQPTGIPSTEAFGLAIQGFTITE